MLKNKKKDNSGQLFYGTAVQVFMHKYLKTMEDHDLLRICVHSSIVVKYFNPFFIEHFEDLNLLDFKKQLLLK